MGLDPALASLDIARAKPFADRVRWVHGFAGALLPLRVDLVTMTGNVAQVFLPDPGRPRPARARVRLRRRPRRVAPGKGAHNYDMTRVRSTAAWNALAEPRAGLYRWIRLTGHRDTDRG